MLLEERNGRFSKCTDLDDVTLEEMKDKYKEVSMFAFELYVCGKFELFNLGCDVYATRDY